ncbi:MAG: hypothetical protein CYPHOPRED_000544 [Cyphobasidiales sp. Tagirdzhanova-0007]|nr:MAG: hypothetical protein CYPHOPRED_000544 [Cyphobasidiales sp. Tagirdzhanova-0007]
MAEASMIKSSGGVFSIHGKGLKMTTRLDVAPYLKILEDMGEDVKEIHLGGNTLGVEACEALADIIKTKKNLQIPKVADFADIFTGRLISEIPHALQALCDALIDIETLVEVDLSDNAFGGRVAEPMVPLLTRNNKLSIFKLLNNGMGSSGGTVIAKALLDNAKSFSPNAKIATVICGRNRLENGSAPFFAEAYSALGASLREVRMVQNGIRMEGISALAKGLQACPNLEILDLQDNTAAYSGSRAIATALKAWPKLKHLNLSDCLLRPEGALSLMNALMNGHNNLLESLKLQSDEIDVRAVNILADAVKVHLKKLSTIELNGNRVEADDESMQRLQSALVANGFEDAIDEIDDVEEVDEEEDEEKEQEIQSEEDEVDYKAEQIIVLGSAETGGEDVRGNESDVVKKDKLAEESEPIASSVNDKEADELASLMAKVEIKR